MTLTLWLIKLTKLITNQLIIITWFLPFSHRWNLI